MTLDTIRSEFTAVKRCELPEGVREWHDFNATAACAEILRLRAIVALVRSLDDEESQQQLRSGASVFVKARVQQLMDAARGTA